ncbi:MAG: Nif11-like leader peptide family natural product precursor [Synechococcaceae cyanobacterium ELA739]
MSKPMSWSELERLVETAEQDGQLRRALRHCRSRLELVMAARRLQFQISLKDLQRARLLHQRQEGAANDLPHGSEAAHQGLEACPPHPLGRPASALPPEEYWPAVVG